MIYLDNNGTTPVLPEILDQMLPYFSERFGNPSSIHECGRRTLAAMKQARQHVAELLDCLPTEILFTSGGTESDNLALLGMVASGDHIITSVIEHSAISQTCTFLERMGCEISQVGVNGNGQVSPDDIRQAIRKNTKLISVMMANNETGVLQPVEEIGKIAMEADVWFHTDAVQAAGKVPISVKQIGCDLLTVTAHKMHGPQGTGALFVRRGTPLHSLLHGGHQENHRRPGTENVAGIVGLGYACVVAQRGLQEGWTKEVGVMRDRLESSILASIPETKINGKGASRVPNTSNITFEHVGGDALVLALDELGIAASRGAACHSGQADPSSVLMAMGISGEHSRSSLRFSLGKQNTEVEISTVIAALPEAVRKLREKSMFFSPSEGIASK